MEWHHLIEVLIGGVALGAVYALLTIGMTLVYGITRVFNFAYGSFFIWGGYVAWLLFSSLHLSYPLVFIITALVMFLFGLACERVIIRPLRWRADWEMTTMFSTLGLAIFLDNTALVSFGPFYKSLPLLFEGSISLGGIVMPIAEMAVLLIAISIMIILWLFLSKTKEGMAMRAVAQDTAGAHIVGIAINRVFGYTFAISTALVAISSILLAPKYFIAPLGGWEILVKAWVIMTFGGMGSVKGTLYAAFILGMVEILVAWQFGLMYTLIAWFVVLIGVLMVRPSGLFGTD